MFLRLLLFLSLFILSQAVYADLQIELTSERVERGEYLLSSVLYCQTCHSPLQPDRFSFPPVENERFSGGRIFRQINDIAVSPNITPYALSNWTDSEILDSLTRGISKDGRVLNPIMPYQLYGRMDLEELYSIIAYLRSLKPIVGGPYPRGFPEGDKPVEIATGSLPRPGPNTSDIKKGSYLVTIAQCNSCHIGKVGVKKAMIDFAGGDEFIVPGIGVFRSANITPDKQTGIGAWPLESFIARFKTMQGKEHLFRKPNDVNSTMLWYIYSYMREEDLKAIYHFLTSRPPTSNSVIRFEPHFGAPVESYIYEKGPSEAHR